MEGIDIRRVVVRKSGWNTNAAFAGPLWYLYNGIIKKGLILLIISVTTLGVGILPIWIYCGLNANHDFYHYLKKKGVYIFSCESQIDDNYLSPRNVNEKGL